MTAPYSRELKTLQKDFPEILSAQKQHFSRGAVTEFERNIYARPGSPLYNSFCCRHSDTEHCSVGIMFHGTASANVESILRHGLHLFSSFTNDFNYAFSRSQLKEEEEGYRRGGEFKVIALAVIAEERQLNCRDTRMCLYPV
jgi:hypothetical protein